MSAIDLEIKLPPEYMASFRSLACELDFQEKPKELVANESEALLYLLYTGVPAVFFSVLANLLTQARQTTSATADVKDSANNVNLDITVINADGEKRVAITKTADLEKLELELDDAFLSIEFKNRD